MGRYTDYFKDIWQIQANRKVIGMTLFGVLLDNTTPFTPGQQLSISDGVIDAVKLLISKGYDFLFITGQPQNRTQALSIQDFENILTSVREIIEQHGGRVKNAYYAPGVDKNDLYVKPNTGMFDRAQNEGMIKWEGSYYIGAEANDVKVSAKIKAIPVLIKSPGKETKTKAFELMNQIKVQEFGSLLEFVQQLPSGY
jgi:histidinol phosphatase-like enzyme